MRHDAHGYWIEEAGNAGAVPMENLPIGPDDGQIPVDSVDNLVARFEELFAEAPVRGREDVSLTPLPSKGVRLDKPYSPF